MPSRPDPTNSQAGPPVPETIGATSAPFKLGKGATSITFEIPGPAGPELLRLEERGKRAFLWIENLKSDTPTPTFDVYLNVREGEVPQKLPERFAFTLSTFGLVESSRSGTGQRGSGLSTAEDVTELLHRLIKTGDWDGRSLRVSFVSAPWGDHPVNAEVGRVSLRLE